MDDVGRPVLRPDQAGEYLSLSSQRLAKLRLEGDGPAFIKAGRSILYRRADLDAWLVANRRVSTSDAGSVVSKRVSDQAINNV